MEGGQVRSAIAPTWNLPPAFEPDVYRDQVPALTQLGADELIAHYEEEGKHRGVRACRLEGRHQFASLVPPNAIALEIGPFGSPLLAGAHVRYADVLDTSQLRARAPAHGVDPANVPPIDYVLRDGSLDSIDERFDAILSSHAIEHQPDLVAHLEQIERRLLPAGRYLVLVPDKRYCFDRHLAPSTIAEVLQAHHEGRMTHTLRSVIEHRALGTHNDPARHWANADLAQRDSLTSIDANLVQAAWREYEMARGAYIDVHAWYFTPDSFNQIMGLLNALGLTQLKVERLYPTQRGSVEFWAVLSKETANGHEGETSHAELVKAPERSAFQHRSLIARTIASAFGRHR